MPSRLQLQRASLNFSAPIAPANLRRHVLRFFPGPQTKMDVGTATAGVSIATVDLGNQFSVLAEFHPGHGTDGRRTAGMMQAQSKKRSRSGRLVFKEIRRAP